MNVTFGNWSFKKRLICVFYCQYILQVIPFGNVLGYKLIINSGL